MIKTLQGHQIFNLEPPQASALPHYTSSSMTKTFFFDNSGYGEISYGKKIQTFRKQLYKYIKCFKFINLLTQ